MITPRSSSKSQNHKGASNGYSSSKQEESEVEVANNATGEEDDDDEEDAEEYVVEKIMGHMWDPDEKCFKYETKWQGWDGPEDLTWEPEENLEGASDTLNEYFESIDGRPQPPKAADKGSKKRGRQSAGNSNGTMSASEVKKPRTGAARGRPGRPRADQLDDPASWGPGAPGDWAPPEPGKDAWEDLLVTVETIEPDRNGEKWAYVRWAEQDDQGRHRKSKEALHLVYQCAPQKMLAFYEKHLVFSSTNK